MLDKIFQKFYEVMDIETNKSAHEMEYVTDIFIAQEKRSKIQLDDVVSVLSSIGSTKSTQELQFLQKKLSSLV